ncbi:hypothetical protein SAMN04488505_105190 [Chitinophaga rupis]|uniref:JmjC domain-containing protein n=1 Tax=Chitinophaga rupis TaxID=573321 RepID=A0A1H7ZSY3_9BACT|nr:hypothetical protein [Chitinophaga rupis]SEM61421.1 hypothetical protein SAMN04488505_105190 [Chitinophaga rupis]
METLQEIDVKKFSAEWWDNFLEVTQGQTKTAVFKNCMDKDETALLRSLVLDILKELCILRTVKYGFRAYVNGRIINTEEMGQIYDAPPLEGEDVETWSARVFGDKKFGMIINLGEKFNLQLSTIIALKAEHLFERVGFPRDGVNFTLFIGNYDKTPLGIHKDPTGQNVIHFHLGPGPKTMYTWDKDLYADLLSQGYKREEVDSLLPYATEFSFEEGDLYFMPEGEFHIGKQEGLSVAVTFWQYNLTKEKLAKKMQLVIHRQFLQKNEDILAPDRSSLESTDGIAEILEAFTIPPELSSLSYMDLMREAYRELRYSVASNAGYRTSPLVGAEKPLFELHDRVIREAPFKIRYRKSEYSGKLHIYVRGVKIEFNDFEGIRSLINKINEGQEHSVSELLSLLDPTWDKQIGLYILKMIYGAHGIRKVN